MANWNEKGKGAGVFCLKNIIEKKKVGTRLLTLRQRTQTVQPIRGKAPNLGLVYVVTINVYYVYVWYVVAINVYYVHVW